MPDWDPLAERPALDRIQVGDVEIKRGDRVRLWPLGRADVMDLALEGKTAVVESIEQDFEDRIYLAVTVEDDPGRDLGSLRQPGHRFFFGVEEVEPVGAWSETTPQQESRPRILIACVGNIFLGDDAFGVEVARRLADRPLPEEVRVVDFGIRGLDLTYALLEEYEAVLLVDAVPRGGAPGTLYVLAPEEPTDEPEDGAAMIETHGMDPVKVLRLVRAMGGRVRRLLVVGCEPSPVGDAEEMTMGLGAPVQAAVDQAVALIESVVARILSGGY
ncbi:MAG TPA: hydrogenase maturation protease [Gemmataceae bacterium]|nr:hydrogenase maturation protease [Gemmataceae bacterium]